MISLQCGYSICLINGSTVRSAVLYILYTCWELTYVYLLLTRCCVNQLGGLSLTQLRTVSSFCMECVGGKGFACTVYDLISYYCEFKNPYHITLTGTSDVQNITYSHLGASLRLRCLLDFHLQNVQI